VKRLKRMRFGVRLVAAFWLVLIVAICIPGIYIYYSLKNDFIETSRAKAYENLDFMEWLAGRELPFESDRGLDEWCTLFAGRLGYRITVIEPGGRVMADSEVVWEDMENMENHAFREEVAAALRTGRGSSIRYSDTIDRHLIYAASSFTPEGHAEPLILRIAMPFSEVETRLNEYARQFWAINAVIFAVALTLSIYFARRFESPLHQIVERIREIGTGDYSHRYISDDGREFSQLSGNINEMADRISYQVETITRQKYEMAVIIENMREGILLLDKDGRIKAVNHAVEDMAGCRGRCIGKKPMEIFVNNDIQTACDQVLAGKQEDSLTLELEDELFYEVYLAGIPEGGALVVFYNVSERKRLEKIRRDFVANVSHELKTPLTSIKGYVETLLSGPFAFPDEAKSFLQTINRNADHMSAIVADLLQLRSLQEKSFFGKMEETDAGACLRDALETSTPMALEKNVSVDNRLEAGLSVLADRQALVQVFGNLLDNAIRYSPQGTTIRVFAEIKNNNVLFGIEDEGPGIDKQHQTRIFERFYRVDKERSRYTGGTGLGLAICRNAVAGMGGEIWVESPIHGKGRGSVFYFNLRKAHADGPAPDETAGT